MITFIATDERKQIHFNDFEKYKHFKDIKKFILDINNCFSIKWWCYCILYNDKEIYENEFTINYKNKIINYNIIILNSKDIKLKNWINEKKLDWDLLSLNSNAIYLLKKYQNKIN